MKPFIQKLPLSENTSFLARTYRTPDFETNWHHHKEYELILFTNATGIAFVGNYVGRFEDGDIFFLASGVPHTFQKQQKEQVSSCVVVQFRDDFWGSEFLNLAECKSLKNLLSLSARGLRIDSSFSGHLGALIRELEHTTGLKRIITLFECLLQIEQSENVEILSPYGILLENEKERERIDRIIQFTIDSFKEDITLSVAADLINMSVSSFCRYFKKITKKTYIHFLNEIRVSHACKLLIDSDLSIISICYESGFGTIANFNKQFLKLKRVTPSAYRKRFEDKKLV